VTTGKALNDFSARITGRVAYTIFSILQSDPNTTEEQLVALLETMFGAEAGSGWYDVKWKHLSMALQPPGMVC
jgi:hypothetical protein